MGGVPVSPSIVIVGQDYIGLPLAAAVTKHFPTIGPDFDAGRIAELRGGQDRRREVGAEQLAASSLHLTVDAGDCARADLFIVAVPTPVDARNQPDLPDVDRWSL